jgi:hypothetical protein
MLLSRFRYLIWIRQNDEYKNVLARDLNEKEAELQNHPEFAEVYDEDKKALAEFRKAGDLGELVIDDADTYAASQFSTKASSKPRTSMGSSVSSIRSKISAQTSLESIHEEDPTVENGGENSDHEDDTRHSTPSPPKSRRTISSAHTDASVSTLGQTHGEHSDESDDESSTMLMTQA